MLTSFYSAESRRDELSKIYIIAHLPTPVLIFTDVWISALNLYIIFLNLYVEE